MNKGEDVLERKVIHAGKIFIKAGEEHARAYLVQNGLIQSFVMDGNEKIIVAEYAAGRIIGESCLMVDEPMTMSYEAVEDTTVVTITRQEFQKKISKVDKEISTILDYVMNKLNYQDLTAIDKAKKRAEIDSDAFKMTAALIAGMEDHKKFQYERAILPHVNQIVKAIKELKEGNSDDMVMPDGTVKEDIAEDQKDQKET